MPGVTVAGIVDVESVTSDLTLISSVLLGSESISLAVKLGSMPTLFDSVVEPLSWLPSAAFESSGRDTSLNDAEEGTGKETGNSDAEGKFMYAEVLVFVKFIGEEESLKWIYCSEFC